MGISVSQIVNMDKAYSDLAFNIESRYKGNWNDSVHDSYKSYVSSINGYREDIHSIRNKVEIMASEIENLQIDRIIREAEALCKEADFI